MLITKFNKMIRNRLLWGIFAVLICIAFVFSFGKGGCDDDTTRTTNAVAEIYGDEVSPRDLMLARYFEMGLRQNIDIPPEAVSMLEDRALQRIAKLRLAKELGLTATDAELVEVIQRDPSFQDQNVFQQQRYQSVVERQLGVPVTVFESYLREEITLQKLQQLAGAFTWTPPTEIMQGLSDLTDQRVVEYVVLPRDTFTPEVEVTQQMAEDYYLANTNAFEVPEKVSVRYVRFDVADFMDDVDVLETNIVDYYNDNLDDYTSVDTNAESIIIPLEEVHDAIEAELRESLAVETATATATTFVVQLMPGRYGQGGVPLDKAAEHAGLTVQTTGLFAIDEELPELQVDDGFRRAAFDLDASDPALSFSDAVVQSNGVYVLALHERADAYVPEFDAVNAQALQLASSNALEEAYSTRIAEVRESIQSQLADGGTLAEATRELALNVVTTQPFSVYSGFQEENTPYALEIPAAVSTADVGDLSEPVTVTEGVLLALVTQRTPATPGELDMIRPQFANSMTRYRASMAYRTLENGILEEAGYKDLTVAPAPEE